MPRLLKNAIKAVAWRVNESGRGGVGAACGNTSAQLLRGRTGRILIRAYARSLLHICLPPVCGCCRRLLSAGDQISLCGACQDMVDFVDSPLCVCCGTGLSQGAGSEDRVCSMCLRHTRAFDRARSVVYYQEPASTLLLRLKFQADTRTIAPIRRLLSPVCERIRAQPYTWVIPVPLHPIRLRQRGLNQALILAQLMFGDSGRGRIVPTGLERRVNNIPQTELSGQKRRKNLVDAFSLAHGFAVSGKTVCVVDDVFTTGATASECARTLKRAGARRVEVWTFARTRL